MPHDTSLITTLTGALVLAFAFGFLATRLRLPPLVGYLLAGVAIGPFTPGFVADAGIASQLAEIGVILLMFGVGLHFSFADLTAARAIALPGAVAQIVVATAIGAGVAHAWGWGLGAALVFGLALSVASTVVLLRALEQRNALDSPEGHIAVGWLIVEDLFTVLALVLLPVLAEPLKDSGHGSIGILGYGNALLPLGIALLKVAAFGAFTLLVGTRVVPWVLMQVARTGSRELFTLSVLTIALGLAYASASLFGVSLALGAFFAGVILSESELSYQAGADSLPLQDAFAVLFFVSVGMLFDPSILVHKPLAVLAVLGIIMVAKSLAAFLIVLAFRFPIGTALTISASLAQIGEFSFILAGLGVTLGLLPEQGRDLIVAGALLSITLNPLAFAGIGPILATLQAHPRLAALLEPAARPQLFLGGDDRGSPLRDHVIVAGYGRVGGSIGPVLKREGMPFVVIERNRHTLDRMRRQGIPAIYGDATARDVLAAAGVSNARLLVIAIPDGFQARRILELARKANSNIRLIARTHSHSEFEHLQRSGVDRVVMGERELAIGMLAHTLSSLDMDDSRVRVIIEDTRSAGIRIEAA